VNEKPVLAFDTVAVGMPLGPVDFVCDDEAVFSAALGGHPDLQQLEQNTVDPALLAGNHLHLIFNHFRIDTAIHAATEVNVKVAALRSDVVQVRGTVAEKVERRGRHFILVESETVDRDGVVVSVERNTLVVPATEGQTA
jgi:hypothetical protein